MRVSLVYIGIEWKSFFQFTINGRIWGSFNHQTVRYSLLLDSYTEHCKCTFGLLSNGNNTFIEIMNEFHAQSTEEETKLEKLQASHTRLKPNYNLDTKAL